MGQPLTSATSPDLIVCDSIYNNTRYQTPNHFNSSSATIVVSPPRRGSSHHLRHQLCDGKVTLIEDGTSGIPTPIYSSSRPPTSSSMGAANFELNFPPPAPASLSLSSPSPPLLIPSSTNTNTTGTALFDLSESGVGLVGGGSGGGVDEIEEGTKWTLMPTPPPIFEDSGTGTGSTVGGGHASHYPATPNGNNHPHHQHQHHHHSHQQHHVHHQHHRHVSYSSSGSPFIMDPPPDWPTKG